MTKFTDEDFELLQREAKKLGFEVIKKTDIPAGHEDEYIDLSTIDISEVLCLTGDRKENRNKRSNNEFTDDRSKTHR